MEISSSYLSEVYDPQTLRELAERTAQQVKNIRVGAPFDALAFTGLSGAALSFPVSLLANVPLLAVRKDGDGTHASTSLEGPIKVNTYMILDDLVASGNTVRRIVAKIAEKRPHARCVGILMWNDGWQYPPVIVPGYPDGIPVTPLKGGNGDKWLDAA